MKWIKTFLGSIRSSRITAIAWEAYASFNSNKSTVSIDHFAFRKASWIVLIGAKPL
jgi:hypothetical protein